MPRFMSEGIEIAYDVRGEGQPVLLVHGFGSNMKVNWIETGWVEAIVTAGYRVIAFDNRGHGLSQKLYDPALYPARLMAGDAINLLDHLGIEMAVFVGYSMGARICAFAALDAPDRVGAAVLGGFGINMLGGRENGREIAAALRTETLAQVKSRIGRVFRAFAEQTGSDREALAACMEAGSDPITAEALKTLTMPVLVAVGSADDIAGPPEPLAALMDKGEALTINKRNHMSASGDRQFKSGVLAFLRRHW
jgi:pimeloyl-ACP methyl ester carboxylesterase